jgi:hypothetical protein
LPALQDFFGRLAKRVKSIYGHLPRIRHLSADLFRRRTAASNLTTAPLLTLLTITIARSGLEFLEKDFGIHDALAP